MQPTHTSKAVVAICVALVAIAFISGYYFKDSKDDTNETPSPTPSIVVSTTPTASVAAKPASYTVKLTPSGLSPAALTVRVGDTVILRNDSTLPFWPASDPHPTHTNCPGFDALRGLNNGESYSLTFTKIQACGYHNHLDPANSLMRGTITVR